MAPPIEHPLRGRAALQWSTSGNRHVATTVATAKYTHSKAYEVRGAFASVQPISRLWSWTSFPPEHNWCVTRSSFDELRSFAALGDAVAYVESVFAMENDG